MKGLEHWQIQWWRPTGFQQSYYQKGDPKHQNRNVGKLNQSLNSDNTSTDTRSRYQCIRRRRWIFECFHSYQVQYFVCPSDFYTHRKFDLEYSNTLTTRLTLPADLVIQCLDRERVFSMVSETPVSMTMNGLVLPGQAKDPSGSPEKQGKWSTIRLAFSTQKGAYVRLLALLHGHNHHFWCQARDSIQWWQELSSPRDNVMHGNGRCLASPWTGRVGSW